MSKAPIKISISVVIPAYNEERRLPPFLADVIDHLSRCRGAFEIIVIDDGSRDRTSAVVSAMYRGVPALRLISLPRNHGKGYAVQTGMRNARGRLRLFCDADGAAPIAELPRLASAIRSGADVAIGSRIASPARGGGGVRVHRRGARKLLARIFNFMVRRLGAVGVHDSQCGFKLFRAKAADRLFGLQTLTAYAFDAEILFLARRFGYRVREVPINWAHQPGSHIRVLRDGLIMLRDLLRIRAHAAAGLYYSRR